MLTDRCLHYQVLVRRGGQLRAALYAEETLRSCALCGVAAWPSSLSARLEAHSDNYVRPRPTALGPSATSHGERAHVYAGAIYQEVLEHFDLRLIQVL